MRLSAESEVTRTRAAGRKPPNQTAAPRLSQAQACLRIMESLPGEAEAAERLKHTSLRHFGVRPELDGDDENSLLPSHKVRPV